MSKQRMSRAAACRTALAAQGFGRAHPAEVGMRHFQGLIDRLALIQLDSINVAVRAHLMPAFSRLGPYDTDLLERASSQRPRRLYEYWGHAASFVDICLEPALRQRQAQNSESEWGSIRRIRTEQPRLVCEVLDQVRARGPITARELDSGPRAKTEWGWNWSDTKHVLEWLFVTGQVTAASRTNSFERRYDIPERVIPLAVAAHPDPSVEEAHTMLTRRAVKALGVATIDCLADYFRMSKPATAAAVCSLEAAGEVVPVEVTGWKAPAWRWHEAKTPRRIEGAALISPFDNLIFHRPRALALFDLDYRIEIYVPAAKRRFGYYVYPLLFGDRFVGRFDLAARRATGKLVVQAAWKEPGSGLDDGDAARVAAAEVQRLAAWQGLTEVEVVDRGDLADALRRALG